MIAAVYYQNLMAAFTVKAVIVSAIARCMESLRDFSLVREKIRDRASYVNFCNEWERADRAWREKMARCGRKPIL